MNRTPRRIGDSSECVKSDNTSIPRGPCPCVDDQLTLIPCAVMAIRSGLSCFS